MLFNKIIKKENAGCVAHTVGDLIRNFNIDIDEFFVLGLNKFPIDYKYDILFDIYYVVELEDNNIHVFGESVATPESSSYTIIFDLKRHHFYSICCSKYGNIIREYNFNRILLNEEDYGFNDIDVDEFICNHFREYVCDNIGELLDKFNLDIELSKQLMQHKFDYPDLSFNEYFVQEYDGIEYYIFEGFGYPFDFHSHPPIVYLDQVKQSIYLQSYGSLGVTVRVYDSNDEEIDWFELESNYFNEINLPMLINSVK